MNKIFNLNLDIRKNNYICLNDFKVGDNLSTIYGHMLQNSVAYDLTGLTLRVNFKDSQGNLYFQDSSKGVSIVNPAEGTFKIDVLSSVLSVEGIIKADISIFKGTQKLTSSTFSMEVVETVYKNGAIIGSNGKDLLQEVVEGEAKRITSEFKREESEVVREKGEAKRESHEIIRESNEIIRKTGYSKMDSRIDNLVLGQGSNTEVIDARVDSIACKTYPTLKARLDDTSTQLTNNSLATITTSNTIISLENATDGLLQLDSIKGRTLKNEIVNGDFHDGVKNWLQINSVATVSNNICKYTVNKINGGIQQSITQFENYKGHKLYFCADVRAERQNGLMVLLNDGLSQTEILYNGDNIGFKKIGGIHLVSNNATVVFLKIQDRKENGWTETQATNFMVIDLTQLFGAGNEPTAEWCNANLPYFDGIKSTGEEFSDVNLFDKSKVTLDSIVSKDGTVKGGNTGWYATDFISVKEGVEIRFNKVAGSTGAGLGLYNKNTLISWMSNSELNAQGLKVRIPKGVNYIRASNHITSATVDNFIINQEEYKIEVLSHGKNLFNKTSATLNKSLMSNTGLAVTNNNGYISEFINVIPNTKYNILSGMGSNGYGHCFYSNSQVYLSGIASTSGQTTPQIVTTPNNCYYIKISGVLEKIETQQVTLGETSTPYEPYKEDKSEILLKEPLKGLPNGVTDEIIGDKMYRRVGKETLKVDEDWREYTGLISPTLFRAYINNHTFPCKINSSLVCNNLTGTFRAWELSTEGISSHFSLPNIYISILKSKLTTANIAGFKKWLTENPTEIIYELAEPIISSVNPSSLKSFKDGSIILNNAITPTVDLKYPTSIVGRLSSVESTLDGTVDRTKKLEEALFLVTTQLIASKEIKEVDLEGYVNSAKGISKIYKNNQFVNLAMDMEFELGPDRPFLKYAVVPVGFRPIKDIIDVAVDKTTGVIQFIVQIKTNGDLFICKRGSLSATSIVANISYITKE